MGAGNPRWASNSATLYFPEFISLSSCVLLLSALLVLPESADFPACLCPAAVSAGTVERAAGPNLEL